MSRGGRVYCGQPKSRLSAPVPVKSRRRQIATSTLQGAVNKVPSADGPNFNSHAKRIDVIDRAAFWISAFIRDGLLRPPLDCAAESRSLEESLRVVVPVASSSEAFALSEQSAHSLRSRGDSNQPSFSAIRLSERFVWTLFYFTLA